MLEKRDKNVGQAKLKASILSLELCE